MIENLTNPENTPVDGDLIRIYHNGGYEEKQYWGPVLPKESES